MRYAIRPLGQWPGPVTAARKSSGVFQADWDATLALLHDEIEHLDGEYPVAIQVDIKEADLRLDGMLKTRAQVGPFPGVIVSFQSRFGPLQYASDAYEQRYTSSLPGWQANVRAVALALEALRAVDRYGVSKRGEQYTGWKALPPGGSGFGSADEAEQWMRKYYASDRGNHGPGDELPTGELYRRMVRMLHPDAGGSADEWNRLNNARQLLTTAGRL